MDELAWLVRYRFISKNRVLNTWDDTIGKCWAVLQEFVREERKKTKWDVKQKAFEVLGEKSLKRVKERERQYAVTSAQ